MQKIFFSLDQVNNPATKSQIRTMQTNLRNRNIKAILVIGSYKGTVETSFCADVKTELDVAYIKMVCAMYNQESFLVVNNNAQAFLHFVGTKEVTPIGRFQVVAKDIANTLEAWTYVPHTDQYFAVKGA